MKEAALNLRGLTLLARVEYAQNIHTQMTGNASFPTPNPTLVALQAAIDAASASITAYDITRDALRVKLSERNTAMSGMEGLLRLLAAYVTNTSGGDEATILSSGMAVAQPPSPPPPMTAPLDLRAETNGFSGLIKLDWKTVRGAKSYVIQCATALEGPWSQAKVVTGLRAEIPGLVPGTTYLFRVSAIGPEGEGPWSDIVVKMAV